MVRKRKGIVTHIEMFFLLLLCGTALIVVPPGSGQASEGTGWLRQPIPTQKRILNIFFLNATHGWAVSMDYPTLQTTDGGVTWEERNWTVTGYKIFFLNTTYGWMLSATSVYQTVDGGVTWQNCTGIENDSFYISERMGNIYFVNQTFGWIVARRVWRTTDGGKTWELPDMDIPPSLLSKFICASFRGERGWVGGFDGQLLYTPDAGRTWENQSDIKDGLHFERILFLEDELGIAIRGIDQLMRTVDGGKTWVTLSYPQPAKEYNRPPFVLFSMHFVDAQHGWVGGGMGTLLHTSDGGNHWYLQAVEPNEFIPLTIMTIYMLNATHSWLRGGGGTAGGAIYHTSDAGGTDYLPPLTPFQWIILGGFILGGFMLAVVLILGGVFVFKRIRQ
ncbi:MAG: YCF48-related protein [Promethearchaeota archaeon]